MTCFINKAKRRGHVHVPRLFLLACVASLPSALLGVDARLRSAEEPPVDEPPDPASRPLERYHRPSVERQTQADEPVQLVEVQALFGADHCQDQHREQRAATRDGGKPRHGVLANAEVVGVCRRRTQRPVQQRDETNQACGRRQHPELLVARHVIRHPVRSDAEVVDRHRNRHGQQRPEETACVHGLGATPSAFGHGNLPRRSAFVCHVGTVSSVVHVFCLLVATLGLDRLTIALSAAGDYTVQIQKVKLCKFDFLY